MVVGVPIFKHFRVFSSEDIMTDFIQNSSLDCPPSDIVFGSHLAN